MAQTLSSAFSHFLSAKAPSSWERESAASHRLSVERALSALDPVNMFETGSLKHGTAVSDNCDSDYFLRLPYSDRSRGPDSALRRISDQLRASFPRSYVRRATPAIAIYFTSAAGTVEITPAFYARETLTHNVFDIPDPTPGGNWLQSAPSAHLSYVNAQNSKHDGATKGLARLLKAWKYHHKVPMSSFYLEMHAARHAAEQPTIVYSWDLRDVFGNMLNSGLSDMNDPSGAKVGRITACSSPSNRIAALGKIRTALDCAREGERLRKIGQETGASLEFRKVFGDDFPYVL